MKRKTPLHITKIKVSIDGTTLYLNTALRNVIDTGLSKHTRCYFVGHVYSQDTATRELMSKLNSPDDALALNEQPYPPAVEMTKSYWKRSGRVGSHYARPLKAASSCDKAEVLKCKALGGIKDEDFMLCTSGKAAACEIGFSVIREAVYVKLALLDHNYQVVGAWRRNYADEMPMNAVTRQLLEVAKMLNNYHKPLVVVTDLMTYLVLTGIVKCPTDSVHNLRRKLLSSIPDVQFKYGKTSTEN